MCSSWLQRIQEIEQGSDVAGSEVRAHVKLPGSRTAMTPLERERESFQRASVRATMRKRNDRKIVQRESERDREIERERERERQRQRETERERERERETERERERYIYIYRERERTRDIERETL